MMIATGSGWSAVCGNSRADAFSGDDSGDIANLLVVEDDDVNVMFHAVVHRLCIHDLQVLGKDITERNICVSNRVRILHWVC